MKLIIMKLIPVLFLVVTVHASDLITNVDHRQTVSLDGKWQIIVDPFEIGLYDYRMQIDENGYFKNATPKDKSDRIEYSFTNGNLLSVPGDWNTQRDEFYYYEGTLWYKKDFNYSIKKDTRVFVYFGAANYLAHVFVNGKFAGKHEGGFTPFNFEITDLVKDGANFVTVVVDNKRHQDFVPTRNFDWWNYGGLTRRVLLIEVPGTFIQDYFLQLAKGSQKKVIGWVKLDGSQLQQKVTVEIPEAKVKKIFSTNEQGLAEITFETNLSLWSPANPKLYSVFLKTETDTIADRIGFRTIETRGDEILLNGKPIFLRGICVHEEAPIRGGGAFSREDAQTIITWAKELNCNFLRLAHYPHNEFMTRLADEQGILLWSEVPVYWTISFENPATYKLAEQQLTEMITRDKNKAAIILWSIANETPITAPRTEFLTRLANLTRKLDPTRLVTAALQSHYADDSTVVIDDPLAEQLDVVGCNEYIGWYDGLPEKCARITWQIKTGKPLIMSETGGGALYGLHGDKLTRWSEEYQEDFYVQQLEMLKKIPFLRGLTPWILMDFRSPRRPLTGIQDGWNRKGLISNRGDKKRAFYVLQKFYKEIK